MFIRYLVLSLFLTATVSGWADEGDFQLKPLQPKRPISTAPT